MSSKRSVNPGGWGDFVAFMMKIILLELILGVVAVVAAGNLEMALENVFIFIY